MALVGEPRKGLAQKAAEPTRTPFTITGVFSATHSCTRVCPHTEPCTLPLSCRVTSPNQILKPSVCSASY